MQGQLDEMRAEQRPWVHNKEMPKITKFIYLPDGSISVVMMIDMENVGHTPAQDASGRIIIKIGIFAADDNLRNDICARAEWQDVGGNRGVTIFPNASTQEGLFDKINKDDITVEKMGTFFAAYIVGCIAYRFAEGTAYHHTPFICILVSKEPVGIPLQRLEFTADEFVCLRQPLAAFRRYLAAVARCLLAHGCRDRAHPAAGKLFPSRAWVCCPAIPDFS